MPKAIEKLAAGGEVATASISDEGHVFTGIGTGGWVAFLTNSLPPAYPPFSLRWSRPSRPTWPAGPSATAATERRQRREGA